MVVSEAGLPGSGATWPSAGRSSSACSAAFGRPL